MQFGPEMENNKNPDRKWLIVGFSNRAGGEQ